MKNSRKLSPFRLIFLLAIFALFIYWVYSNFPKWKQSVSNTKEFKPWFASYVDVTATPRYAFEQIEDKSKQNNIVLSFIVSSSSNTCTPSWGSVYNLEQATKNLDLDRRIARFRQLGGEVSVSFGGAINDELSVNCKDLDKLLLAYKKVIDQYNIQTIDLDLEGNGLKDPVVMERRSKVIAKLQNIFKNDGKNLSVWLTLPVTPDGLSEDGTNAVSKFLSNGVEISGINVMTMDFGESKDKNQTMAIASEKAAIQTQRQIEILYKQTGIYLSDESLWSKIGLTVMIGQNDIADEVFTLNDAIYLNKFTLSKTIARVSMWSANRDIECGENYVNTQIVSDSCSGIKQTKNAFSNILGTNFLGSIDNNIAKVVTKDSNTVQTIDKQEESPYQIWSESGTYLEGTKVVWHKNVYQAKWWTQGDIPDNPVLQSYQTPWQLIGPVLPGEKPIPSATLAPGTYPIWSGSEIYDTGKRVLFNGIPYQAKWWTQGESPAASTSNPDSSPWILLSQEQIDKILKK